MEEGSKAKKTVFVGGIGEEVNEEIILEAFSVFGVFGLEWHSSSVLTSLPWSC